jgi:septum formation protein
MQFQLTQKLVLASQSPRRLEILTNAGLGVEVRPSRIAEVRRGEEAPREYVQRLAREKARAIAGGPGEAVLGADTVVVVDGDVLEKPISPADAVRMVGLLAGRAHEVLTGVCLLTGEKELMAVEATRVRFAPMSVEELQWYAGTGEGMDKAGGYAIQGLGSRFIVGIEGCYWNVVGLPLRRVYEMLRQAGLLTV